MPTCPVDGPCDSRPGRLCACVWGGGGVAPRNPFESAPTTRFNNPKVLPLLQTMSLSVQPCRRGCPAGTRLHIDRCRQRTTAPALRTIRTTATHTLHARVPYRSPHPSPMHPLGLKGWGEGGAKPGTWLPRKNNLDGMQIVTFQAPPRIRTWHYPAGVQRPGDYTILKRCVCVCLCVICTFRGGSLCSVGLDAPFGSGLLRPLCDVVSLPSAESEPLYFTG